jgi:tetratricopeptide (TPR) repeat protein
MSQGDEPTLEAYLAQGLALEEEGRWEEARSLYEEAAQRFPQDPQPVHRAGVMYVRLGKKDLAEEAFREALRRQDGYAPSLTNLGNLRLEEGHVQEAISYYQRAIAAQPDYPGAHHNLGVAYRRLGRLAEAVAEARLAARYERRYQREQDRLRLRAQGGCLGRAAVLLLPLAAAGYLWAHLLR